MVRLRSAVVLVLLCWTVGLTAGADPAPRPPGDGPSTGPSVLSGGARTAPNPPTDFVAAASSSSEIELDWTAPAIPGSGLELQRSDDQGQSFHNLANLITGVEHYVDTGLAAETEYRYRLRTVTTSGVSVWAGPVIAVTLAEGGGGGGGGGGGTTVEVYGPTADAYVDSRRPTLNYGGSSELRVRADKFVSFLSFEVQPGAVEAAVLRLTPSAVAQVATSVAATDPLAAVWDESTVTWTSHPAIGATLGNLPPGPAGTAVELDVTDVVAGAALADGRLSLALQISGAGQTVFSSREAIQGQPELVVTYSGDGGPPSPPGEPLPHLEVGPSPALMLEVGDTVQLEAAWMDAEGNPAPLPPGSELVWTSSNPERVTVDADGMATVLADDAYTVILVHAAGADQHVPGAVSIASGTTLKPGLLDFDPALVQSVDVIQDPELESGYLVLTVDRTPATEALGAGDLAVFGPAAAIEVETRELLSDGVVLHGSVPPIEAIYDHLNIDLDSVALDRMADVYVDAGFQPWDGSDIIAGSASGAGFDKALLSCDKFTLSARFSPEAQLKIRVQDGKLIALAMLYEGTLGLGMPEARVKTGLRCDLDIKPRLPLGTVPIYAVATFNVYLYIKAGLDFTVDFGQDTSVGELGGPTFEMSTGLAGGLEWDDVDGLRFPGSYSAPSVTGRGATPYLDGLQAATMSFGAAASLEGGVRASLYPGLIPVDPTGVSDKLIVLNFDFLATRYSIRSDNVIPLAAFGGPADPDYANPSYSDSILWDFFVLKSIDAGPLTQRILRLFGWENILSGPVFSFDPFNIYTFTLNYTEPELTATEDTAWIGGWLPYAPSSTLSAETSGGYLYRQSSATEIWGRRPGAPEFSLLWSGSQGTFSPMPGDEGEWEFRAVDRPVLLPFLPLVSAVQTVTAEKAPAVQLTPREPEILVPLGEVGQLDIDAFNTTFDSQTYTLSMNGGPASLTLQPSGPVTLAGHDVAVHTLTVDCTHGISYPRTQLDLALEVDGDANEYTYPLWFGCVDFSLEPPVVKLQGSVSDPPVLLEGEMIIHNVRSTDLAWETTPVDQLPFLIEPASGVIASGADQVVTLSMACTTGGLAEYPFEVIAGADRRTAVLHIECEDSGGNSWGDPHLVTYDGVHYDFQAHGEMVLTRAPGAGFEVQTRQSGTDGHVSYNRAAALRVGTDRVAFYTDPPGGGGPVMVDGTAVDIADGTVLPLSGGGSIERDAATYTVRWPSSGSYARIKTIGSWMSVRVHADAALAGTLEGLLGDYDGDGSNDFVLRDGSPLPSPPSFAELYDCPASRCFAYDDPAGWIIRDAAESLFDYDAGLGPLDYAPADGGTYPLSQVDIDDFDPDLVAWAQSQCIASGISDPVLLEACILDLVVTGNLELALEAADVEAGQAGEPGVEICDGDDNDGNSLVDDGDVCSCTSGTVDGHTYFSCGTPVEREAARKACRALGTGIDLARITDPVENLAVVDWLRTGPTPGGGFWIGPTDEGHEGTWLWPDGSPVTWNNWGFMQPSGGADENCVELVKADESWNDLSCTAVRGFVCE
ncbi:MAG: DNRLRE domain-containing protein [Acidobacteria bacterium]|nr:DNRLRE domain-containing protein [Acidobacteriota bacterium]